MEVNSRCLSLKVNEEFESPLRGKGVYMPVGTAVMGELLRPRSHTRQRKPASPARLAGACGKTPEGVSGAATASVPPAPAPRVAFAVCPQAAETKGLLSLQALL